MVLLNHSGGAGGYLHIDEPTGRIHRSHAYSPLLTLPTNHLFLHALNTMNPYPCETCTLEFHSPKTRDDHMYVDQY